MNTNIITAIIAVLGGAISGGIINLIAPFVKGKIERNKSLFENRTKLIHGFRNIVLFHKFQNIRNTNEFAQIKTHLSKSIQELIESVPDRGSDTSAFDGFLPHAAH